MIVDQLWLVSRCSNVAAIPAAATPPFGEELPQISPFESGAVSVRAMNPADRDALAAKTAEIGEYFALPKAVGDDWRALPRLFDDATIGDFVARTRAAIAASTQCDPGEIPLRLAASSFQLGVTARLLSPAVGAASCFGAVPSLDLQSLRWRPNSTHSPQFAVADADWIEAPTPRRAADLIAGSLLTGVLAPLNDTLDTLTSLSPQVSWGNVISAANGAVTVLSMSRPHDEGAGRALVRALADTGPLVRTATFLDGRFVRRSCCLFYQAPGSGLCGDCVLVTEGSGRVATLVQRNPR